MFQVSVMLFLLCSTWLSKLIFIIFFEGSSGAED